MPQTSATADAGKPAKANRKKKKLSAAAIGRRVTAIKRMEDKDKVKKGRRRLLAALLRGIADGSIAEPDKAAREFLALSPRKRIAAADDQ